MLERYGKYIILFIFISITFTLPAQNDFTVVIDAGHGGRDAGCVGSFSYEKDINLAVALKLGKLIESNQKKVKIVYTRDDDTFIELNERANIANRHNADLFISIHTNSVEGRSSVPRGTETFTLGLDRSAENLAVAMRENSVILMEDDYQQKYAGFDPNSTESYIMFETIQGVHMEQSVQLASEIQKAFAKEKRVDRGVKQGGLLVLRKTSMPAVLIELGFITNRDEERYLNSHAGQDALAKAIYSAVAEYKGDHDRKYMTITATPDTITQGATVKEEKKAAKKAYSPDETVYRIQVFSSNKQYASGDPVFKGYKGMAYFVEKGVYKYIYGESTDYDEITQLKEKVSKDFKGAFIIGFRNGRKVTL